MSYKPSTHKGKVAIIVTFGILTACTHSESKLKSQLESATPTCEQMTQDISKELKNNAILNGALDMTSQGVAYGATAAGYILDYTVLAAAGVVTVGLMCPGIFFGVNGQTACLPFKMLSIAEHTIKSVDQSRKEFPGDETQQKSTSTAPSPNSDASSIPAGILGPKIYKTTASFREDTRLVEISRAYRGAARCYVSRGDKDSLIKAYWLMKWVSDSAIHDQVPDNERQQIHAHTSEISQTLNLRYPSFQEELNRKQRQLASDLIKSAATLKDWQSPKDGSMWFFVKAGVQTGDRANVACSYLERDSDPKPKLGWRLPTVKELEKAAESGLATANQEWDLSGKSVFVLVSSEGTSPKTKQYRINGKKIQEEVDTNSPAYLLCTL